MNNEEIKSIASQFDQWSIDVKDVHGDVILRVKIASGDGCRYLHVRRAPAFSGPIVAPLLALIADQVVRDQFPITDVSFSGGIIDLMNETGGA